MKLLVFTLMCLCASAAASALPKWDFDAKGDFGGWKAVYGIASSSVEDGRLRAKLQAGGCYFACDFEPFEASPYQLVEIRLKSSRAGIGNLLWLGEGQNAHDYYRRTPFKVTRGRQTLTLFPFWQTGRKIRGFRFDLSGPADVEIDYVRILPWPLAGKPRADNTAWRMSGNLDEWRIASESDRFFAPPPRLNMRSRRFVIVRMSSKVDCEAYVLYAPESIIGCKRQWFKIIGDGRMRDYNVRPDGLPAARGGRDWYDPIVALGLEIPREARQGISVESVTVSESPAGPARLAIRYFGFDEAVNRAGKPRLIVGDVENIGGTGTRGASVELKLPDGVTLAEGTATRPITLSPFAEPEHVTWPVVASKPGTFRFSLFVDGEKAGSASLRFLPPVKVEKATYPPEPRPVKTRADVFAYYFPGWETRSRWDFVRYLSPERRPLLGYYDENNPEMVDWQIKAAVENGITGFVVDWYWFDGKMMLEQWIQAYGKSRYRDKLKVFVMWCNHMGKHTVEDMVQMTRYCAREYFGWESYYRIDGKPVFAIWDSPRLRQELGGSEGVRKALEACENAAREAGYPGLYIIESGMDMSVSADRCRVLAEEGYDAFTTYHDFLGAYDSAPSEHELRYAGAVRSAVNTWEARGKAAGSLTYFPVVETGWDARPWHGDEDTTQVMMGRTPELFESLLRKGRAYAESHKLPFVMLGPVNEWGEGSYIEPCVEYGFDMYERVRKVFALGDPASWPLNVAPSDVGLGPYEMQPVRRTRWTFDDGDAGWSAATGIADLRVENGVLRFHTNTNDPALQTEVLVEQGRFSRLVVRMSVSGASSGSASAWFFWGDRWSVMSEPYSVGIPITADGIMRDYTFSLSDDSFWRGTTRALRFDPCDLSEAEVAIEEIRFE